MDLKLLVLLSLCLSTYGRSYHCSEKNVLLLQKRPCFEFSMEILDRVTLATGGHFVFSPLYTYMQLNALAEGAKGRTFREIRKVTRHHPNRCFRRKFSNILRKLNNELSQDSQRQSIMILDELLNIKSSYIRNVETLYGIKVLPMNFNDPVQSTAIANEIISKGTKSVIKEAVYYDDFNSTVLLQSDTIYFKSDWQWPFNSAITGPESFYSESGDMIGTVNMMTQVENFNMSTIPHINAKVLELPCKKSKFSMLVFLPLDGSYISDVFYALKFTTLASIFNTFSRQSEQLVTVKIPRFKITSNIDILPELLYDMGIKRIFNRELAQLKGISEFKVYSSLMTQVADIEVTEEGVVASVENLTEQKYSNNVFVANKTFAFMIVDRETQLILFAGMYNQPKKYTGSNT